MMRIVGINCSPRKDGNTNFVLSEALKSAEKVHPTIQCEQIDLGGRTMNFYPGTEDEASTIDDDLNEILDLLSEPDVRAIIIATPVYMGTVSGQCKVLIDRSVALRRDGFKLRNKVGGAIAVGGMRNGGQEAAIQTVHAAMQVHDMVVAVDGITSHYGGIVWASPDEGAEGDRLGQKTARNLGKRVAELMIHMFDTEAGTTKRSPKDTLDGSGTY